MVSASAHRNEALIMKYVTTRQLPLSQLEPYPGNARRGDVGKIRESLRTNGQYRSLIVRKTGEESYTVLAGNNTLQALTAESMPKARCEVIVCDDAEALRINLVDNRTADAGSYDDAALADLLKNLDDLTGTGYTSDDTWMFPPPPVPTLDALAEEYGEPEEGDIRVTLKFTVTPQDRQLFYELTEDCSDPDNESSRFAFLLGLAGFSEATE
jgi:hypothetical protein